MDVMEAMKNEGNALFQQQRFDEAVRVYTSVLDKLRDSGPVDETAARLEIAVRLNRAWARVQIPNDESSEATLAAAEQDCSSVIAKDASCVKAFYRRALARERRGQWKLAIEDASVVKQLEPGNPSIAPLLERLQQRNQEEDELTPNFQQCTLNNVASTTSSSSNALAGEAEDAWKSLQAAEIDLLNVYSKKRPSMARRKQKEPQKDKREISQKTDDLWESLRCEEITTVAKAFPRSKKGASIE
ncbi:RNA polymerase II-associated protein 3 [Phytophthora nicotianae]|uniref:RNA polymerase II-associated protein 3 n=1 Tax=Phytophthora nicotianae TaxID=4792 RepID=A0A0W8CBC8_PHYNI|nr:RNA polymerase II-associated protein 3 [Phytophthora nicotianae]